MGKRTYVSNTPEFFYAKLKTRSFNNSKVVTDSLLHIKRNYMIGQKVYDPILTQVQWKQLPTHQQHDYTRGILRVLGKAGRDLPNTKKHELFIPYPASAAQWADFPIQSQAIERFEQLSDERTEQEASLPYELLGTNREPDGKLRIKEGDLVYFKPTLHAGKPVVTDISFSSIWRGRVENDQGKAATVYDFFAWNNSQTPTSDPEILPFHAGRKVISPAELLFGFVQIKDKDAQNPTEDKARALAGRVQISFAQLAKNEHNEHPYEKPVTLKILASPKLPSPSLYFKNRSTKNRYTSAGYIKKSELKPSSHQPQGRKVYLHSQKNGQQPWKTAKSHENANQKAQITPLKTGTDFYFHVDFNNLSQWELGLLCYALRPNDTFRHKLGMGKSIGLGTVRIDPVGLCLIDRHKRYAEDDIFTGTRYHHAWIDETAQHNMSQNGYAYDSTSTLPLLSWQELRKSFRQSMSDMLKQALELLGDPNKIKHPVHTPRLSNQQPEHETFKWFVENEKTANPRRNQKKREAYLKPLDEVTDNQLPTLPLWQEQR